MIDIDTLHFTGNYVEQAKVEGCVAPRDASWMELQQDEAIWTTIVEQSHLVAGTTDLGHNFFPINPAKQRFTHIRLTIFPDGGISRLK